jgi:AcrR family transcriptional regulator
MTNRRVIEHAAVVRGGIHHFLRRSTLDMDALAAELAISRATLYRVAQSRDALLAEIFWALSRLMLDAARKARTRTGVDGVIEISRHFGEQLLGAGSMRQFLAEDREAAARVLFTPAGPVHEGVVAAQLEIFAEAGLTEQLGPDADLEYLAFLYVRIVGSALYAGFFTGRPADFAVAERALRALLSPP